MSRFNDPVVVGYDIGAYSLTLGSWLWNMKNLTHPPLNRDPQVLLAYHKWPLHVGFDLLCRFPALTSTPRWEYLTTLDFELDVIRGRRPYRWTIWVGNYRRYSRLPSFTLVRTWVEFSVSQIYSLTRVSTLMAVILSFVAFDTTTPINCHVGVVSYVCLIAYND